MTEQKPNTNETTEGLLSERDNTHGSFIVNGRVSQRLKNVFRAEEGWEQLDTIHKEAIDHICGKFGRIMAGQPEYDDHWDDIAGYAQLPKKFNHGKEESTSSEGINMDSHEDVYPNGTAAEYYKEFSKK